MQMVVHELAHNAKVHGVLAHLGAMIAIRWTAEQTGQRTRIDLMWRETGVPIAAPPERRGFGIATLIDVLCARGAQAELRHHPDGIEYRATLEVGG